MKYSLGQMVGMSDEEFQALRNKHNAAEMEVIFAAQRSAAYWRDGLECPQETKDDLIKRLDELMSLLDELP